MHIFLQALDDILALFLVLVFVGFAFRVGWGIAGGKK